MIVQFDVIFEGNVQGVGFRYTVLETSQGFDVVGFVQNMPDRSVRLVCEGDRRTLQQFLQTILERRASNITGHRLEEGPAEGKFDRFQIRG